jgi:hypothetical protein
MEWEVMFLCNTIGILLLILIAFFHLIGVEKEDNGEIINTDSSSSREAVSVGGGSASSKK